MVPKIPNLRHLHAIRLISACGSLQEAADGVHLSQSALTQGLSQLEGLLGTALFERTAGGMRATAAGERFLARVERAFEQLQWVAREVDRPGKAGEAAQHLFTATELRAVVAVVRAGGYSLAARDLGLSQPSVFRAAKEFEALFSTPLFRRAAGGIESTRLARQLARRAGLAVAEIRQGIEEVAELRGETGSELVVGCLPLARSGLLPDSLTALLDRFPGARVRIIEGSYDELLHGVLDGAIDLIIGALRDPAPAGEVRQEHLFDDMLSIIVRSGHPLLGPRRPQLADIGRLDWIVPRRGAPARQHFEQYLADNELPFPPRFVESSSLIVTRSLLLRSDRAAILSNRAVALELEHGILAELAGPLAGTERSIGIATRKGFQPTALQQYFIDSVRSRVAVESPVSAAVGS